MTAPATSPPRPASVWRAVRLWVAVGLAVVVVTAIAALASDQSEQGFLDPDAPTPDGGRALATLLRDRDVQVDEVDNVTSALGVAGQGDVTLFVPFPALLSTDTIERLAGLPDTVRVVLVEPDMFTTQELGLGVEVDAEEFQAEVRSPGCDLPEAASAGPAEVGLQHFAVDNGNGKATVCYGGSLVRTDTGNAEVILLGAADPLVNDRLDEEGNAALAIGLLNEHDRVLWLIPSAPEPTAGRPVQLSEILPPWVPVTELLLILAAVLAALSRGRRLGPPVSEPLPVVVRSAETAEGRARLYRRARASSEAYEALRAGALARLLPAIGLGPEPDYRAVVEAVADRSGHPVDQVHAVLYGPPPTDDAGLVAGADLLDTVVENTLDPTHVETALHRLDGEGRPQ